MRFILILALVSISFVSGCGDDDGDDVASPIELDATGTGYFTDRRDGKVYRAVKIGDLIWMAENLNYKTRDGDGSWCYVSPDGNADTDCSVYGRYYNWTTAMAIDDKYLTERWSGGDADHRGVCPAGWRMPNNSDWNNLAEAVGGRNTGGQKLKSAEGRWHNAAGLPPLTDEFGFSAQPGTHRTANGYFSYDRFNTKFWSATDYDRGYSYYEHLDRANEMIEKFWHMQKNCALNVRCVTDI